MLDLLGLARDYEIATMNETVAGIISDELTSMIFDRYYPEQTETEKRPSEFDLEMRDNEKVGAVIAAGGSSQRMGEIDKLFAHLHGKPLLSRVVEVFQRSSLIDQVVLVLSQQNLEAGKRLALENINVRVISMPSWELFDGQPLDYRESVLSSQVRARVAIEAGIKQGWEHYVGLDGAVMGLSRFGASAPAPILFKRFEITAEDLVGQAKAVLRNLKS